MQIDLSLFMSDRQFGYFGHWKHLLSLLHYREFWGRRQGGKGGGVKMRRDYFLEKLADAMVHIGEILFALTLAKVLLC